MTKVRGLNKYQRAARKPGERRVSRTQVAELIALSGSDNAEERLLAAELLCPCHVRGRVNAAWDALYRLMADEDPRVRMAAWHTIEDGGLPDEAGLALLEGLFERERDPKVRGFADRIVGAALRARQTQRDLAKTAPASDLRGKCDFCAARDVPVRRVLDTMIPTAALPRPALECISCGSK